MNENKKKRMLVIGITMNSAGTEKSFLSFANCLDYDRYEVDLLLAKKEGDFLPLIPEKIRILEMEKYGEMFLLSAKNAAGTIWKCFGREKPWILFEVLPYFLKIVFCPKKRSFTATRMWCRLMRYMPEVGGEYDVAVAYWGDRTMFYMAEKVKAAKKIAWLHFDYSHPPRDDELYLKFFLQCDKIVTVSQKVDEALREKLPQIADRTVVIENIQDSRLIWKMALTGDSFPDPAYEGKRILTIGRISDQKGFDMIPPVLRRLRDDGYELRWYIVGGGEESDRARLIEKALACGVADMLILLGTTVNPYGYMRDCDLYVMTSRYEGKPITVEEAKIMFRPILVTNYLSAAEQLADGKYGDICEISEEGIYQGLKRLLDDPERCDAFTETLSKARFSNTEEIEKFYRLVE